MHTLESYAANCSLKIDKPHISELFFPTEEEKYITLDASNSKNPFVYDYWQEVVNILKPALDKKGISIIQLGKPEDKSINSVNRCNGNLNYNQTAYIIRHSLLHLSSDAFSNQIAASYNKKMVVAFSEESKRDFEPYWGDQENQLYINGFRKEKQKSINSIKPEEIAKKACKLLDIDLKYEYETLYMGAKYKDGLEFVETIPNQCVNLGSIGVKNILFRMDLLFDEKYLVDQLQQGYCSVITRKPINMNIIKNFKEKISELVYFMEEDDDASFCKEAQNLGINVVLVSYLTGDNLDREKLKFMEINRIIEQQSNDPADIKELQDYNPEELFYKSNKYTLSDAKIYPSEAAWEKNAEIKTKTEITKVINNAKFWRGLDNFAILKKVA
jgi:hypothetical protein